LHARRERPRNRRTAEQHYEIAPNAFGPSASQARIAGYRIYEDQSGGLSSAQEQCNSVPICLILTPRPVSGHTRTFGNPALKLPTAPPMSAMNNLPGHWLLKVERKWQRQMSKARLIPIGSDVVGMRRNLAVDSIFA
jgi:hypothetical protein